MLVAPVRRWSSCTTTRHLSQAAETRHVSDQKVGKFLITVEGDILHIFKSEGWVKDKTDKDTAPVVFFRAPTPISTVDTSGEHIVVGCQNGEVLRPCSCG
jgi:hypothetical protein